jgi:hypothetical protein
MLQLPRTADGVRFNSPADWNGDELSRLFANMFRARAGRN